MIDVRRQEEAFEKLTSEIKKINIYDTFNVVDYRGKTPRKTNKGIQLITAKNIKKGFINYSVSEEFISEDDFNDVMSRGKVKIGDVLFTTEAPVGNYALVDNENIALAQRVIKFSHENKKLSEYLMYYFSSEKFKKYLYVTCFGSTVSGISKKDFQQYFINIPQNDEYIKKIANFLTSLDSLIQKQEEYIELLKIQKKGYIDFIFCEKSLLIRKGRNIKLSDLFSVSNIGTDKKYNVNEIEVNLLNYMDVYKRKLYTDLRVSVTKEKLNKILVQKNDIFVTPSSETAEDIAHFWGIKNEMKNYVYSYHIIRLRPKEKISVQFYEEYFNSRLCRMKLARLAQGAQRYTLSIKNFETLDINVYDFGTQQKIGEYFNSLGEKIEIHEKKLEQLKLKKKYYLNSIFK